MHIRGVVLPPRVVQPPLSASYHLVIGRKIDLPTNRAGGESTLAWLCGTETHVRTLGASYQLHQLVR